ncbi:hypothetical protein Brms1b_010348 [Colletotrichum noveboracense]|nr:hypothetical protein COL940_010362 [Colletotrichum noveboracense]KAJ0278565.1 hypothetical protein CBS470a_009689 [Colletotrichum nupharicola]KAJ0306525.1 hypothetical protein Brms1b_010348 [Colletotrichum noveboracense]
MGNAGKKRRRVADDVKPIKGKKPRLAKPPAAAKSNKKLNTQPSDSKESLEPNEDKCTCIVAELSNAGHNTTTTTTDLSQYAFQQTNDGANRTRTVNSTEKPRQEEEEEEDDDEVTGKGITLSQMWEMTSAMPANPVGV